MSLAVQTPPRAPRTARVAPIPRRRSADPFTLAHWRTWTSDLVLDDGSAFRPEPFQDAFVEDLFSGRPECWLVVPEGNGKTTLLAAICLYHVEHRPFGNVPVAAASREQAEILYRQAEGLVLRSPALYRLVDSPIQRAKGKRKTMVPRFQCLEGYRRINHHAGGRIQVFAADDRTGDGVIPTMGVIDEPHRQRDLSLYRTWAGKLNKRGGQLVAISTSGEPDSDFELTRERIRAGATEEYRDGAFLRAASPRVVLHEWALPETDDPDDLEAVKRANPLSTVTVEQLREKHGSPTMTVHHWMRFVCNRPTRDADVWLGPDSEAIWKACEDRWDFVPGAPTWVGLDLAIHRDTSAAVTMQRRPDGRYHAKARIWTPTEQRPIDLTDVMQHVREEAARYDVEAVSYDPRFFDVPAKLLELEGIPMVEVPQAVERMMPAVGSLYEGIHRGVITHDGDQRFSAQVLNAVPRFGSDRGFTLAKSKSRGKIDACIGLVLAYDQALRFERPVASVYESRGAIEV